jgi:hypothetical protein
MRLASVNLAKVYTKRVLKELDGRDTAGNEAALVAQSVRFTYRVHQVRRSTCIFLEPLLRILDAHNLYV